MLRTIKRWLLTKLLAERKARRKAQAALLLLEARLNDERCIAGAVSKEASGAIRAAQALGRLLAESEKRMKAAEEKLGLAETTLGGVEADNERLEKRCEHLEKKVRHLRTELDKRAIPDGLSRTWDPEQA